MALVVSNLVPLLGVLLAGWGVFPILLLFSLENVVIGFYNVLRMRRARCDLDELRRTAQGIGTKWGLIAFFCVHYGMFVFGHLLFVVILFGMVWPSPAAAGMGAGAAPEAGSGPRLADLFGQDGAGLLVAWGMLWVSHGISYRQNFIKSGEYKRVTSNALLMRPYGRIVVMHVTIIIGGMLALATGLRIVPLVILVGLKITADLVGHLRERDKFRAGAGPEAGLASGRRADRMAGSGRTGCR